MVFTDLDIRAALSHVHVPYTTDRQTDATLLPASETITQYPPTTPNCPRDKRPTGRSRVVGRCTGAPPEKRAGRAPQGCGQVRRFERDGRACLGAPCWEARARGRKRPERPGRRQGVRGKRGAAARRGGRQQDVRARPESRRDGVFHGADRGGPAGDGGPEQSHRAGLWTAGGLLTAPRCLQRLLSWERAPAWRSVSVCDKGTEEELLRFWPGPALRQRARETRKEGVWCSGLATSSSSSFQEDEMRVS